MLSKPQGKEAWFPLIFHWLNFSDHRLAGIQPRDDNLCNCETIAYFVIEASTSVSKYVFSAKFTKMNGNFLKLKKMACREIANYPKFT